MVNYPASVSLARLPTPIERIPALSDSLGVEVWVKRDDLTGMALSGNKIRKLEFLMAEAQDQGADTVITCGAVQSNHCRATAVAAVQLGLHCVLVLRGEPEEIPTANHLLDQIVGAECTYITPEQWADRDAIMQGLRDELAEKSRVGYIIPEGGSNAFGAWGYVRCVEEIRDHSAFDVIVCADGSGGTHAGLVAGKVLWGLKADIIGYCVCDDADFFRKKVGDILGDMVAGWELDVAVKDSEILCEDHTVGIGYAQSKPEELEFLVDVARRDGLILDPVYSGKALFGLVRDIKSGRFSAGSRILFIHTGGLFGLFPKAGELPLDRKKE